MNDRILKAIDEVKIMLNTYNLKRDTTRIKEILYSLQDVDNYNELLVELNDIGNRYWKLCKSEEIIDFTHNICGLIISIIQCIQNTSSENLWSIEYEVHFLNDIVLSNIE